MNEQIYPDPSRRSLVYASRGMVATSQHLAAQAGLDALKKGGNAVDAAVATAMALTVVEPCSNGIGGDAFCIAWMDGKLYGLNASGPASRAASAERVRALGHNTMPAHGPLPVTVPGIPSAWAALSKRFGRLPLTAAAEGAISYARDGYPLSPMLPGAFAAAARAYKTEANAALYRPWYDTFMPTGTPPAAGETLRLRDHARTLETIAASGAEDFYRGELARRIAAFMREHGGFLTAEDLAAYAPEWVEPVSTAYRGYDVWELPPNGQGLVALMALKILNGLEMRGAPCPEDHHRRIEAVKLAFTDGLRRITDPRAMDVSVDELLSDAASDRRRAMITDRALMPGQPPEPDHGTVYLCAADADGNMVSYIQSNYMGFGSGCVVPGTGIALQNRGANFSLDETHANCLRPGKRTYHTIIPGFLTKDGGAVGPFGVMGGFLQPQAHVQVLGYLLDCGYNPQAALDAPRWSWSEGRRVTAERGLPDHLVTALRLKGHEMDVAADSGGFGRGQIIFKTGLGGYMGATEPRADGAVAAW